MIRQVEIIASFMRDFQEIGFGGGCHWCTEAVFQSLNGVKKVQQGYISVKDNSEIFYEGVIVSFDANIITLKELIKIHLQTHKSTSNHSMRSKYLSAVYTFNKDQYISVKEIINSLQKDSDKEFITKAYYFGSFKASRQEIKDYYKSNPEKPFCKTYIEPKLQKVRKNYPNLTSNSIN